MVAAIQLHVTLRRRCGTFLGMDTGILPLATERGTMGTSFRLAVATCLHATSVQNTVSACQ